MARQRPSPRQAVQTMAPYHPPSGGRSDKLRLDFNENTVGASPAVIEALQQAIQAPALTIYPEYARAMEVLSGFFGVDQEEMILTNGTDEAIAALVNTFVDDGEEALILTPSYAMYKFYAELAGADIVTVPYREGSLAFPLSELLDRIHPLTKAIFISNPNNPTGTAVSLEGIERLLKRAPHAAVLIDEAYYEFCGVTAIRHLKQYPNLFVSRTFSKVYGMAAMRVGCLFSNAENMKSVKKCHSPYSVNTLAVVAATAAVQDTAYITGYVTEVLAARELMYVGLEKLTIPYYQSEGNFVLFRAGDRSIEVRDALRERGVLVRDRSYEIPGCVRATVGTREQVRHFLQQLEEVWRG